LVHALKFYTIKYASLESISVTQGSVVKKLLKIAFLGLILAVFLTLGGGAFLYFTQPTRSTPYPYIFTKTQWDGLEEAAQAQVLLVGDRMGARLGEYLPAVNQAIDPLLRSPLRVVNWSRNGEGLHRTLQRLKQLETWPRILIFHGLSQELEEQRFFLASEQAIATNFVRFDQDWIASLIMSFPVLSRFLYFPHRMVQLDEVTPYLQELEAPELQRRQALTYLVVANELNELITLSRRHNTELIFITTPINLELRPRLTCENAQTPTIIQEQRDIDRLLEAGLTKEAYARAKLLAENTPANAYNYYLKGMSAIENGIFSEALGALQMATAYDCRVWRGNVVLNQLLMGLADAGEVRVIDFDYLVNQNLGRDSLFLNELYPQEPYYLRLTQQLIDEIKRIYRL
jgi:hypothetical protein